MSPVLVGAVTGGHLYHWAMTPAPDEGLTCFNIYRYFSLTKFANGLATSTTSRRVSHALSKQPETGSLHPESTPTTPELDYGVVALTVRPPTQSDHEEDKMDLRDEALLAQLEEEKGQRKKPQTIPNPRIAEGFDVVQAQHASEELEKGEISDDTIE